jgi:hypothetical protein
MTGLRGGKNPKRETVVESHSCAKDAQEWGTLGWTDVSWTDECVRPYVDRYSFSEQLQSAGGTWAIRKSATRLYASI